MGKKEEEEEWHEEDELEKRDGGEGVRGRRWRKRIGGVGGRARLEGRRSTYWWRRRLTSFSHGELAIVMMRTTTMTTAMMRTMMRTMVRTMMRMTTILFG